MIVLKNISKSFIKNKRTLKVLKHINLELQQGEILGIIGYSGAGKSTLLRCINLLEQPDEGDVVVNGTSLTKLNSRQLAGERRKIGMIFQHFNLMASKTVYENVALPLELEGLDKSIIKVNALLKLTGLEDKSDDYPKNLSGGQKQRVAIARALANDPYVLLCDEATSALDPASTQSILQLLQDINLRLGITILLITHEMDVIKAICNYVAVIDKGELIANGPIKDIFSYRYHPVIRQFITPAKMQIPQSLHTKLQSEPQNGLFPLVELQLEGNISFDKLLAMVHSAHGASCHILKADVDYIDGVHLGKILVQLKGDSIANTRTIELFRQHKIQNAIKGYA